MTIIATLVVVLVGGCITTSPLPPGSATASPRGSGAPASPPVLALPMDGPTVIDVPSETVATGTASGAGLLLQADGVSLDVPAGAVAAETQLGITRLNAPFHMDPYARVQPDDVAAIAIGPAYDLGPAGVRFTQPVTVTLSYNPAALPAGADPSQITTAYFTGTRWKTAGGTVDSAAHTVSVRLQKFDGIVIGAVALALAIGIPLHIGIKWWFGKEGARKDPISEHEAAQWVTPDDPTVMDMAAKAYVGDVPIGDPDALAQYMKQNGHLVPPITLQDRQGNPRTGQNRYFDGTGSNWQRPADYLNPAPSGKTFDGVPAVGDMRGDCTDVTNAMVSIFRVWGYPAKGVFGYRDGNPHAWGEVLIGDTPYLIDEDGKLQELDKGIEAMHLVRPAADDPRAFMWDENGQTPYEASWWTKELLPSPSPPNSGVRQIEASVEADVELSEGSTCSATVYLQFGMLPPGEMLPSPAPASIGAYCTVGDRPYQPFGAQGTFDGHNFVFDEGSWHWTGTLDGDTATITGGPGDQTFVFTGITY